MKFSVFNFFERYFKFILFVCLLIIVSLSIYIYNYNDDYAFYVNVGFSIMLFGVSVFITVWQMHISNLFYIRKNQYKSINRLHALYCKLYINRKHTSKGFSWFIYFHLIRTGRYLQDALYFENPDQKEMISNSVYISEEGIKYTSKFTQLETKYFEEFIDLRGKLNYQIGSLITNRYGKIDYDYREYDKYEFKLTDLPRINDQLQLLKTNILGLDIRKEAIVNEIFSDINKLINDNSKHIQNLIKLEKKLNSKHKKSYKKTENIKRRLEKIYGERFNAEEMLNSATYQNFKRTHFQLDELKDTVDNISNNIWYEEELNNSFCSINTSIDTILEELSDIKDMIMDIEDNKH